MRKDSAEQLAQNIVSFYNEYNLHVAGKINNQTAFQLIETIEKNYKTDNIRLSDGTRIWNLLRIFIYSYFQKLGEEHSRTVESIKKKLKSTLSAFKESCTPLCLPKDIRICGFSSSESRKLYDNSYYDIYLDPLYEILGDNFAIFEWPETSGYRRKYNKVIYSKHYVPMHFPLWSKTFWYLFFNRMIHRKIFSLKSEKEINEIIGFISITTSVDRIKLATDINNFISVFVSVKYFLYNMLNKIKPTAVLIRCGYGRFPMALSQACRELNIPSIELQHGILTLFHPAYCRSTPSENKDCIPEYLLAFGNIFADIVRQGNLFQKTKVFSTGYPYLEKKKIEKETNKTLKNSYTCFSNNLLFTSQWIIARQIQQFVMNVAELLEKQYPDVGILFKPHPYDQNDYSNLQQYRNIILIDKYEDTYKLFSFIDIHSTVYSTSGLEAMAFGIPNIFIDIYKITDTLSAPYIADSPIKFIESVDTLFINYQKAVLDAKAIADIFFTRYPEKCFQKVFTDIKVL